MLDGLKDSAITIGLIVGALLLIWGFVYMGIRFARTASKDEGELAKKNDELEKANEKIEELEERRP